MRHDTWQKLIALESRDAVAKWHQEITGRELSARRAKEITSAAKQAREFFRNATAADNSVRPLLSFYGVSSLSRATTLLLKRGSGEESLAQAHGLEVVGWSSVLMGDVAKGISSLEELRIRTCGGLFSDFVRETANGMCIHVHSSAVDWRIAYDLPQLGEEISLGGLLARIPDLLSDHQRSSTAADYAYVNGMALSKDGGFTAKVLINSFEPFKAEYEALGYNITVADKFYHLHCDAAAFEKALPQFMHTYVNRTFGTIPSLHIVRPFSAGSRYSQLAATCLTALACSAAITRLIGWRFIPGTRATFSGRRLIRRKSISMSAFLNSSSNSLTMR
jgi:YaaC-like Protein